MPSATAENSDAPADRLDLADLLTPLLQLVAPALAIWRHAPRARAPGIAGWILFASLVAYVLYARDKRRARLGEWRTPESVLHGWELAGGWPGAWLAQRRLRHKNAKFSFQFVFWAIVGLHNYIALDLLLGWRLARAFAGLFRA